MLPSARQVQEAKEDCFGADSAARRIGEAKEQQPWGQGVAHPCMAVVRPRQAESIARRREATAPEARSVSPVASCSA